MKHTPADQEFSEALLAVLRDYPTERFCHDAHKALSDAVTALQESHNLSDDDFTTFMNALRLLREKING